MTKPAARTWMSAVAAVVFAMGVPDATPHGARTRQSPPRVELGMAKNCAAVAGDAVISTNLTSVTGNVGVSPGNELSGFPPGQIRGAIHLDDATSRRAMADAAAAYRDAATRMPTATVSRNLGGKIMAPGVYDTPGGVFEITGTLTLDAEGDPNAAFIFQARSALNTARVSNIDLVNGAQAGNVIWQVGGDATLGSYSTFRGAVLALNSVHVTEGTALYGHAVALHEAVTFDGTTVLPTTRATTPDNPPTGTTLTSSPNPARRKEPVTFTAAVSGDYRGFSPTGEVVFRDGSTIIGSAMLDESGVATFTTAELTRGVHPITAVYVDGGTAAYEAWVHFAPSESPVVNQQILNRG
ncbi:ice-binding family protein [Nonomuraea sp. NPDC049269]|uniref:ice-binding family protein n=1 Tax=Nonomuraea sp. NPDC049269 TaxID=3364349 RepID=UPI0037240C39